MDLRVEEQRTEPRVAVQFQAMVSGSMESEGTGTILDLSQSGCRLRQGSPIQQLLRSIGSQLYVISRSG
jgi:hypothetical protein